MTLAEYQQGDCRDCGEPNCPEVYYRNTLQHLCENCRNKRGNAYIRELEQELRTHIARISELEARQVRLLAEIAGLKSQGTFTVRNGMIYCEDEGVMLNPALGAIADKLNAMQARISRMNRIIEMAPHEPECILFDWSITRRTTREKRHCNCWKSKALKEAK